MNYNNIFKDCKIRNSIKKDFEVLKKHNFNIFNLVNVENIKVKSRKPNENKEFEAIAEKCDLFKKITNNKLYNVYCFDLKDVGKIVEKAKEIGFDDFASKLISLLENVGIEDKEVIEVLLKDILPLKKELSNQELNVLKIDLFKDEDNELKNILAYNFSNETIVERNVISA